MFKKVVTQYNPTPVALAVAMAMLGSAVPVFAADAAQTEESVVVTGIRASKQKSLNVKRNAAANVEVVTAEDIGKMPDKNVADSLQRLPGVTISTSVAGSGGFDENDRVSLRGTSPDLTQTLINGHGISSGDWFVLDQVGGAVGRSASYSLLPSELVGQVIVSKSPTADLVEGGVAGTVNVLTRKPLDFKNPLTLEGSVTAVHATLPSKTDPQFAGLINFKNEANTFGVMLQGFSEKRSLRRDGQELFWTQLSKDNAAAKADPRLTGVWFPNLIGSALFEQERKRVGGLIDVQAKPTDALTLDLTYFSSKLNASNYNRNWMAWAGGGSGAFGGGVLPDSYDIRNGTLIAASWANKGTDANKKQYAIVDQISRPGAYAKSEFVDFDAKLRASDLLTFKFKAGATKGTGETPAQNVAEFDVFNTGLSYTLNGLNAPATVVFPSGDVSNYKANGTGLDWIFGYSPASTEDKEKYAQLDGEYTLNQGMFTGLKFGVRGTDHDRSAFVVAQGPKWSADPFNNLPSWNGETYPSNYGGDLAGNFPKNVWQIDRGVLDAWGAVNSNRDVSRTYYPDMFKLNEKTTAAYVSTDLEGDNWSGNFGVRFVKTKEDITNYQIVPNQLPGGNLPAFPWGGFVNTVKINNSYNDILPTANLRIEVAKDLIARLGVSRTMTRPGYGALGGAVTLDDKTLTGNGGNPYLKPVRANNLDATLEWYHAPRALVSAGLFYQQLLSYVGYGKYSALFNNTEQSQQQNKPVFATYTITAPINTRGSVRGFEVGFQQPVGAGFGVDGNLTYADAHQDFGTCETTATNTTSNPCDLLGASKVLWNVGAFYEQGGFNARVSYNWRSHYLAAADRGAPLYQDDTASLAASINYELTKQLTLSFDAQNLNNPVLKNYVNNPDQPRSFYTNGRQYYIGLRFKY